VSEIVLSPPAQSPPEAPSAALAAPLRRVRQIGYMVLGCQLVFFLAWSAILYHRFALTSDFATYHQPWFLIAHGNLDPYSTISYLPFWQNDAEFMPWVLAPLYWIWPHDVLLLWVQDASVVGAEMVAFTWICELARRRCQGRDAAWLAGLGLVLLAGNPWMWWAVSFDVHEESLVILFTVLLAWDLARGKRRAWAWVVPVLAGGAPSATYVVGLGLGGVLAGQRSRATGAAMMAVGLAYSMLIVLVHGDAGVPLTVHYGYLASASGHLPASLTLLGLVKGIANHPLGVLRTLWAKRIDVIANLAPGGLLGLGASMVLPLVLVVLLANSLSFGFEFAAPMFQSLPIYVLLPVGTVALLGWVVRRHRRTAVVLGCLLGAQALGWAAVWVPQTPSQWLRVPGATASTLASVEAGLPASAEVIASQGVIGRFSGRTHMYAIFGPGPLPVDGETWFVIVPADGIELQSTASAMTLISELAGPLRAVLVTHANGVWVFRWRPPPGVHTITVPGNSSPVPAWTAPGVAGRVVTAGLPSTWHVTSTGDRGYVADELQWQEPPGRYQAQVTLSTTGPVNVEVWNDTGNTLLARQTLTATDGVQTIALPVEATTAYHADVFSGWGPFRADFIPPPAGNHLEVRVWSPGGSVVNVYSAEMTPAAGSGDLAGPHREAADDQLALAGHGLGHGEVVSPGSRGAGHVDRGGEPRAENAVARRPERDTQAGVIARDLAAQQAFGRGLGHPGREVAPPASLAPLGAADDAEIRGERGRLVLQRRARLAPPGGGRTGQGERAQRRVILL
jgi:hypothetical protein